mmetsp:Transcript_13674/g.50961  ORF Transcript_13674/g.50961 Transcript_13674/m.50961 type:complete len:321 (+) Transcript_13674:1438-2400(+)
MPPFRSLSPEAPERLWPLPGFRRPSVGPFLPKNAGAISSVARGASPVGRVLPSVARKPGGCGAPVSPLASGAGSEPSWWARSESCAVGGGSCTPSTFASTSVALWPGESRPPPDGPGMSDPRPSDPSDPRSSDGVDFSSREASPRGISPLHPGRLLCPLAAASGAPQMLLPNKPPPTGSIRLSEKTALPVEEAVASELDLVQASRRSSLGVDELDSAGIGERIKSRPSIPCCNGVGKSDCQLRSAPRPESSPFPSEPPFDSWDAFMASSPGGGPRLVSLSSAGGGRVKDSKPCLRLVTSIAMSTICASSRSSRRFSGGVR